MSPSVYPAELWPSPLSPARLAVLRKRPDEGDHFLQEAWKQTLDAFQRFQGGQEIQWDSWCGLTEGGPDGARRIMEELLNTFVAQHRAYELSSMRDLERFRDALKKGARRSDYIEGRPLVRFDLIVHGVQLIDPTNLIFELQGEASVGSPFAHVSAFLANAGIELDREKVLLDGILPVDEVTTQLLRSLLQIRMRGGKLETGHSYLRYGSASDAIWLIQEFQARIYLTGDYLRLPFDCFPLIADFNVGMGGDAVNVAMEVGNRAGGAGLFSEDFDAGEFQVQKLRSRLRAIAYLEDPTHFVDNIARLEMVLYRPARHVLLRIGLPLLAMVVLLFGGAMLQVDNMTSGVIPTIIVAIVGLQLTSAQGMPRNAPASLLDYCFFASYAFAVSLFFALELLPILVPMFGAFYLLAVSALLSHGWQRRRALLRSF